jgi:hypothetical protein
MARPRKPVPAADPFIDLAKKTEILEREMDAQRAALERLRQISEVHARPLRAKHALEVDSPKQRISR